MERPLIYYALSVYIGCLSLIILEHNFYLGILFSAIFLAIIFFCNSLRDFIIVVSFFIIGCMSFGIYFNVQVGNNATIRIVEKKRGSYIGDYKGRKVILHGNLANVDYGVKIKTKGTFYYDKDYSNGIIGSYNVIEFVKLHGDFTEMTYSFKRKLYNKYSNALGKRKAAVIMGVCYGDDGYLDYDMKNEINKLGIAHIISVSGFHIAAVYKILEAILGIKLGLIGAYIYMIFTGSEAATVRSFIMILISKLSKVFYKNYDPLSSLSLSGLIILMVKPYYVLDIGFNLSYLATLGIIFYYKKIQRILYILPNKVNEELSITLSSQVFSMPYAMCTINNISMFFIPGNLILAPLYSLVVVIGTLGIVFIKIDVIFNLITYFLYSVMTAIEGGTYFLLKISPPIIEYSYYYGVCMLFVFIIYILVKYGYKNLKYYPLVIICFIILYSMV